MNTENQQAAMPQFAFNFMRIVMSVRKVFRNIDEEIGLAGIKEGDIILDYGCGLGYNTIPAAKKVGKTGKVIAYDISPQAIKTVKKKIAKNKLSNVEVVLSNGLSEQKKAVFDIVYLHNTLPLIENKEEILGEISKLLKSGGRLSYVSRAGSRIYGKNTISNTVLINLLEKRFSLKHIKEKKQHLIFEKQLS